MARIRHWSLVIASFLLSAASSEELPKNSKEELIVTLSEPKFALWKSQTFETSVDGVDKILRVSASLNEDLQRFTRFQLDLGKSHVVVPPEMLRDIDAPQLHTMLSRTSSGPDEKNTAVIEIIMRFGKPALEGSPTCTAEEAKGERYKEARFAFF